MINPLKITEQDLPLIVLADDMRGFIAWVIKSHSEGNYNHIMTMTRPGFLASQDPIGFREVKIQSYMKNNIRLKFWQIIDITPEEKQKITEAITKDLKGSWWDRRYDYLGIIGQFLHLPWINNTWTRYCSERVRDYFKDILTLPIHPSPSEINAICKTNPRMKEYGFWEAD